MGGANQGQNAWTKCINRGCSVQEPFGLKEVRILTSSPFANSTQPLSVICSLALISKLVRAVFTYKKSIEKAWLAGALTGFKTHETYANMRHQ